MDEPDAFMVSLVERVGRCAGQGDDLDRLAAAADLAAELADLPDRLVGQFVDRARSAGATWSQIGQVLGVSRQAAQQRTVPAAQHQYTERAELVVQRAHDLAHKAGQVAVGPGLILAACCGDPDAAAARTLAACGIDVDELGRALVGASAGAAGTVAARPRFTVAGKQVLDQAGREAQRLGHRLVGSEHLLLAALRRPEGLPPSVVRSFSLSYQQAAARLPPD